MATKSFSRRLFIFGVLSALTVSYQNCAPFSSTVGQLSDSSSSSVQPAKKSVNVIVLQGHMGRTVLSCDGGYTWIHDVSDDDTVQCGVNSFDCDHNAHAGHGITFGNGQFYVNYGWGYSGSLRSSTDGFHWQTMRTDGWGNGVVMIGSKLLLAWNAWQYSTDAGATWTNLQSNPNAYIHDAQLMKVGDHVVAFGTDSSISSSADGITWSAPTTTANFNIRPGLVYGNGVIIGAAYVVIDGPNAITNDVVIRSTDNGATWTSTILDSGVYKSVNSGAFDGANFYMWGNNVVYISADGGVTWTTKPSTSDGTANPAKGQSWTYDYDPTNKTFIAFEQGVGYAGQKMYVSTDGVAWKELDSQHFKSGHPLFWIAHGQVDSSVCQ